MAGSSPPGAALGRGVGIVVAFVLLGAAGCTQEADPEVESSLAAAVHGRLDSHPVFDNVRAIVVNVDGETIFEEYHRTSADGYWPVQSVTKSVVSTLVGIAVDQRLLRLDQTLGELLTSYRDRMQPRQAEITVEQVLTMTAGFPPESRLDVEIFYEARDPVARSLALWTGRTGEYAYSNAGAHLLSAILVEVTGMSVLDYARQELFRPLGIDTEPAMQALADPANIDRYLAAGFAWPVDRQGRHLAWAWLKLRPTDLVKLGQLYLADGVWGGEQVVSSAWVTAATSRQVGAGGDVLEGYGYQWRVGTLGGESAALAWGYGGQAVAVVPAEDLVAVVSTEFDPREPEGALNRGLGPATVMNLLEGDVMANLDSDVSRSQADPRSSGATRAAPSSVRPARPASS